MNINEIIGRAVASLDGAQPLSGDEAFLTEAVWSFDMVGAAVQKALAEAGYEVVRVNRGPKRDDRTVTIESITIT